MDANAAGRRSPTQYGQVLFGAEDQLAGDTSLCEDALLAVDVVEEHGERAQPLLQALLDFPPLLRGDEPRQQADGEDLLRPAVVVVDGEGHALVEQRPLGERLAAPELQGRAAVERVDRAAESGAGLSLAVEQLVPDAGETAVAAEQVHRSLVRWRERRMVPGKAP